MYKPGDRVRCIDDSQSGRPPVLQKGQIYIITSFYGTIYKEETDMEINTYTLSGMARFHIFYETRFVKVGLDLNKNSNII